MNLRTSFGLLALSALALSCPLAANAATAATAGADPLTCKMGSPNTVITNNGSETIPAGTMIVVRFYPNIGAMSQKTFHLKSALAPGLTTSFAGETFGYYQTCSAHAAS
jgi:hypothetical protein